MAESKTYKASTSDYLQALLCYPSYLNLLEDLDKKYQPLKSWLLKKSKDDTISYSIKKIAAEIGLKPATVTKQIKKLYELIYDFNEERPELFMKPSQILCDLHFSSTFKTLNDKGKPITGLYFASFYLGLDCLPRKGEELRFDFLIPMVMKLSFHVREINHIIIDGKHTVDVWLATGDYDSHLNSIVMRAEKWGLMTWDEVYGFKYYNQSLPKEVLEIAKKMQ